MDNPTIPTHRYIILDGMRGIAAIAVMLHHYTLGDLFHLFDRGGLAVDLFFILSGFVISYSYQHKLLAGKISYAQFIGKRLIRLYPMYFIGLVLGVASLNGVRLMGESHYSVADLIVSSVYNVFFIPYFNTTDIGSYFPANGPSWSLFWELFVNIFCLSFFRLGTKKLRSVVIITYAIYLIDGALRGFPTYSIASGGSDTLTSLGGAPRVFYGFALGILLQRLTANDDITLNSRMGHYLIRSPLSLYVILLLVFMFPLDTHGLYNVLFIGVLAPFLVFIGSQAQCSNVMTLQLSRFLGWRSYPVYCLHLPMERCMHVIYAQFHVNHDPRIAAFVMTFAASIILTKLYEEPLRRKLTKLI